MKTFALSLVIASFLVGAGMFVSTPADARPPCGAMSIFGGHCG
jgi:hypothetical protein